MKKILLFIYFSAHILIGQEITLSNLEYINSLPEDVRNKILSGDNNFPSNTESELIVTDNLSKIDEENLNEELEKDKKFGFSFFNSGSVTNTPILDIPLQSEYLVSFGDEVEILITGSKNALYTSNIDLAGNVTVPEIGLINILDLSINEATEKVNTIISKSFFGANVYLSVKNASYKKISVIGSVNNPGSYLVNPFVTLSEAIKYAGGLQDNASLRKVMVIKNDGTSIEIDMYDFLVNGDRTKDLTLRNGDTVNILAAKDFYTIAGSVQRPMIYEHKKGDTLSNLIDFAQGSLSTANLENVTVNVLDANKIVTKRLGLDEVIPFHIDSIFIPAKSFSNEKELFVQGEATNNGYFDYEPGTTLGEFMKRLSFTNDIYPFYFSITQTKNLGLNSEFMSFRLKDIKKYKDVTLSENVELLFYSKMDMSKFFEYEDQFQELQEELNNLKNNSSNFEDADSIVKIENLLSEIEKLEEDRNIKDRFYSEIPEDSMLDVRFGGSNYKLPMAGNYKPKEVFDFMLIKSELDFSATTVNTRAGLFTNSFEGNFVYENAMSLTIPNLSDEKFNVIIKGEVKYPGTYTVDSSTSLNDLYEVAGGIKETANQEGIYFSRESVKQKEKVAYQAAKDLFFDTLLNSMSNPTGQQPQIDLNFLSLLDQDIENFSGRISGDLSFDSETSNNLKLEEGDLIIVAPNSNTVTIAGEVLSPVTVSYNPKYDYLRYLDAAGGLTNYADKGKIFITKADGTSIQLNQNLFQNSYVLQPGDTITVPRDLGKLEGLPLASVAIKIISDIAFAAASLNAINN